MSEPTALWDETVTDRFLSDETLVDCEALPDWRFLCIQSEERPESDDWFQFVLNFDEVLRIKVPK